MPLVDKTQVFILYIGLVTYNEGGCIVPLTMVLDLLRLMSDVLYIIYLVKPREFCERIFPKRIFLHWQGLFFLNPLLSSSFKDSSARK